MVEKELETVWRNFYSIQMRNQGFSIKILANLAERNIISKSLVLRRTIVSGDTENHNIW